MDADGVRRWVRGYEDAWRSPGTSAVAELFTEDATYRVSPWAPVLVGREAIAGIWESERDGPDEVFTMTSEVVAVDGDVAVVRAQVDYERTDAGRWRDLWVLRFSADGRCSSFEEWPFAPDQPDGH